MRWSATRCPTTCALPPSRSSIPTIRSTGCSWAPWRSPCSPCSTFCSPAPASASSCAPPPTPPPRSTRRPRPGGRRVGRLGDDRAVHLLLGRPQRVDRRPARPVRARTVGPGARRTVHPAALDGRQQHAVHAHAARPARPPGRPDGGSPVIKTRSIVLLLAALGVLVLLPLFLSPNLLNAAIKMMIAALFALAFTLAMGQAGMLSFGHAAYYGLGAFAALHLMRAVEQKLFGFPTPLIPLAGALAGFVFGLAFGWFATQRTGVYFSMVTLALAELLLTLAPTWNGLFGGESGIATMRGPSWGVSFGSDADGYYLTLAWFVVSAL